MFLPRDAGSTNGAPSQSTIRSRRKRVVRAKTINVKRLSKRDIEIGRALYPEEEFAGLRRPQTRADCKDSPRPCPFVACKHHLYLDVEPNGSIRLRFPDVPPDEMEQLPSTCEMDVIDRGGATLEAVAEILNLTRERVRQVETVALAKLHAEDDARMLRDAIGVDDRQPVVAPLPRRLPSRRRLPVLPPNRPDTP